MSGKTPDQRTRTSLEKSHISTGDGMSPRPRLTLVLQDMRIAEIWVNGRAPIITIHDYDWGETDPDPAVDDEGFPFSPINWNKPAWMLGLSVYSPEFEHPSHSLDQHRNTSSEHLEPIRSQRLTE